MTSLGTTSIPAIPGSRIARDATDLIRSAESGFCTTAHCACTRGVPCGRALRGLRYDRELLYIGAMSTRSGLVEGHRSEHDGLTSTAPTLGVTSCAGTA